MNSVNLTGRFTRDPEIRYTDGGSTVASFSVAVDRRFKADGGPQADFIRCVAFGKTAEFAEKYFRKGQKIEITGRIQTGSYQNNDGQTVYTTDVVAEQVGFAESKSAQSTQGSAPTGSQGFENLPADLDEELPF